jgi:hypothetical protein
VSANLEYSRVIELADHVVAPLGKTLNGGRLTLVRILSAPTPNLHPTE